MKINNRVRVEQETLLSGAKIINIIIPSFSMSVVSVWFRAGARFDPLDKEGLAHFFEHLLMNKTIRYPDRHKRLRIMDLFGIYTNAFTTNELAYYYHISLPKYIFQSLSLIIDGVNDSIIKKNDIEKEKEIILNEELLNRNNPSEYIWRLSNQALWPKSMLGRGFFGNRKSIQSITLKDMMSFQKQFYVSANTAFVIIGNEQTTRLVSYIKKRYRAIPSRAPMTDEHFFDPLKITIEKRAINQATVAVNYKTVSVRSRKDIIALDLIKEYLSNRWTSRFIDQLRVKRNITYWVSGESENYADTGCMRFTFVTNPVMVKDALSIILREINLLQQGKIELSTLNGIKNSYHTLLIKECMNSHATLWWYGRQAIMNNDIMTLPEYIQKIKKISIKDMTAIAKIYFQKKNLSIVIIGNIKKDMMHNLEAQI